MTLKENIMKLQTYKMFEGEDTLYVERDDVLKLLEQEPKTDSWSIKDVADTFKKHGLIREQETSGDLISREAVEDKLLKLCNELEGIFANIMER